MSLQKSTIVRPTGTLNTEPAIVRAPAGLRPAFQALERVSPRLGGAVADWLWFRLPAVPPVERRERHAPPGGEPFTVDWSGGTVSGRVYGDWGAPTAYLLHGWAGWWQQLGAFIEPLLAAGMCVVAIDAPSHGDSAAGQHGHRSTTLVEFADGLGAVVAEFGRATAIITHSAGAMATLHARRSGVVADAYAFISAPVGITSMMHRFSEVAGVGPKSGHQMIRLAEKRVGIPMSDFDVVSIAGAMTEHPPLLIVHDRTDPEAPVQGAEALHHAWPASEMVLTSGLGHRRILWDPAVAREVTGFVAEAADRVRRCGR